MMQLRIDKRLATRQRPAKQGFTLVELMTVVAIIGVAATLAIVYLDKDNKAQTAKLFAQDLGAQYEMARARAVARQKIQKLVIGPTGFAHYQYRNLGLSTAGLNPNNATSWDKVAEVRVPGPNVSVALVSSELHFDAAMGATVVAAPSLIPAEVPGALVEIHILPDGRARTPQAASYFESGWTVFVTDGKLEERVMLMAVTGTSTTLSGW